MVKRIGLVAMIALTAGCRPHTPTPNQSASGPSLRESLIRAWHEVRNLDHPILSDAAKVEPSFNLDAIGLRSARLSFIKNAVWRPKASSPGPVDASQPYIWVTISLWRPHRDAQPSVRTRGLHVGKAEYAVDLWVVASDRVLADRVQTILGNAFEPWYD